MSKQRIALRMAIKSLEFAWEHESPRFEEKALDALWKALVGYDFWTPEDMSYRPNGLSLNDKDPVPDLLEALEMIAYSNNSEWQADCAKQAIAKARGM